MADDGISAGSLATARLCPLTTPELAERIVLASERLCGVKLYRYQRIFALRAVESVLVNDGMIITALWARQCGKTTTIGIIAIGMCVWLPLLAQEFQDDERLNSFIDGFCIGIFAPIQEQSDNAFQRIRDILSSNHTKEFMGHEEVDIAISQNRADSCTFTNGSFIRSKTASEQALIEGRTYHLVICEEAQKLVKTQIEKAIKPMLSSTNGSMICIGTAWEARGAFFAYIQWNVEFHRKGGSRCHFEITYDIVIEQKRMMHEEEVAEFDAETKLLERGEIEERTVKHPGRKHTAYEKWLAGEIQRIGGTNQLEFRMNFMCRWNESRVVAVDPVTLARCGMEDMELTGPTNMAGGVQVAGLDLGKKNDRTVLTLGWVDTANPFRGRISGPEADPDQQVFYRKYIQDWLELDGAFEGTNGQYELLTAYLLSTNCKVLVVDSTGMGGDVIFERLELMIGGSIILVPFTFQTASKSNMYKYYLQEMRSARFFYPAGEQTKQDIRWQRFETEHLALERDVSGNHVLIHAPDDDDHAHDDYPDSAALFCWAEKIMDKVLMPDIDVSGGGGGGGKRKGGGQGWRRAR